MLDARGHLIMKPKKPNHKLNPNLSRNSTPSLKGVSLSISRQLYFRISATHV